MRDESDVRNVVEPDLPVGRTTAVVPVSSLLPADTARIHGENVEHTRLLAESGAVLPPILVHRKNLRVIDGMHRLWAARLRGAVHIDVEFFDGSDEEAFVRGVEANVRHGLALSKEEREAAVVRVLKSHPQWSDRSIAEVTGLSAPTVGNIRRRVGGDGVLAATRIGKDGRSRPLNGAEGRIRAAKVVQERPDASLREIARQAGISVGTARDVRDRLRRGENAVTDKQHPNSERPALQRFPVVPQHQKVASAKRLHDSDVELEALRRDPSVRFSDTGRSLLLWLGVHSLTARQVDDFVEAIPGHWAGTIADLAQDCAEVWNRIAETLAEAEANRDTA